MAIVFINVVIFSPALGNFKITGESTFQSAFSITLIIMSIIVGIFENYTLLMGRQGKIKTSEIKSFEDCMEALKRSKEKRTFTKNIDKILEQIERLERKKDIIKEILLERFSASELTYRKFQGVINNIEKILYINIKGAINKITIFDDEEYREYLQDYKKGKLSEEVVRKRMVIYEDYIDFVEKAIEDNEEILLKLDRFLLELSKLDTLEEGEIENMVAMKELDELTKKIKLYK